MAKESKQGVTILEYILYNQSTEYLGLYIILRNPIHISASLVACLSLLIWELSLGLTRERIEITTQKRKRKIFLPH